LERVVAGEQCAIRLRPRNQSQRNLERDAEQAFAADKQPRQIRSDLFDAGAAQMHDVAIGHDRLHPQHVIGRHAMTKAVRAARVECHVAANRADGLAGRIGCVIQAMWRGSGRYVKIHDARFNDSNPLGGIETNDPVQSIERDDDPVFHGNGTA
jgi:hypothetical protein